MKLTWLLMIPLVTIIWQCSALDWTIGIFVRSKHAERSGGYLYPASIIAFVSSYLEHHNTACMAMVVDDETAGVLRPLCQDNVGTRCISIHYSAALQAAGVGAFVRKASVYVQRHFLNEGAIHILSQSPNSTGFSSLSYVLLTDVRDVIFEEDVFARMRRRSDVLAPGDQPLWFAMEHFDEGPMKGQLWNMMAMRQCFPAKFVDSMQQMPVSCSGTTVGSVPAIVAYVHAMQSFTLFCSGPGRKPLKEGAGGMDQPAHMALLYDVIMSRVSEPGWDLLYGRMFRYTSPPATIPHPFHPEWKEEEAYTMLSRLARKMFSGEDGLVRVVPIPTYSPDGEICTFGVIKEQFVHAPPLGDVTRFPSDSCEGRPCPPCALVHQYDRHQPLTLYVIERYANSFIAVVDP